jgi:hypothetical protein
MKSISNNRLALTGGLILLFTFVSYLAATQKAYAAQCAQPTVTKGPQLLLKSLES